MNWWWISSRRESKYPMLAPGGAGEEEEGGERSLEDKRGGTRRGGAHAHPHRWMASKGISLPSSAPLCSPWLDPISPSSPPVPKATDQIGVVCIFLQSFSFGCETENAGRLIDKCKYSLHSFCFGCVHDAARA